MSNDDSTVKLEPIEAQPNPNSQSSPLTPIITLSSSSDSLDSDSNSDDSNSEGRPMKKRKSSSKFVLPLGFLDPLDEGEGEGVGVSGGGRGVVEKVEWRKRSGKSTNNKQFWKAGDYEDDEEDGRKNEVGMVLVKPSGGLDHLRVHPKFLHSNATSHKWALGAIAELLDNSLDEVCYGATFVNIDVLENKKDKSQMLLIEDNGGGMEPDKMRQCMSLGYSAKSKIANTIGQYGNGFKTSTMRLGADVIVFSRFPGKDGKSPTESIGMLSYTFLRSTKKEDIVVPMLDYEKRGGDWKRLMRSSPCDWTNNVEAIVQWSPYTSESDLLSQFNLMNEHGTRIIIYNLWEDDQGDMELDFDTDPHDIQIRGANRDEQKIEMAKKYPNSKHFLTYRHSLRSYASILYLRLPLGYRIVLRGVDVEHHNLVNDMMLYQEVTYRPNPSVGDGISRDANIGTLVRLGFVKDAKDHIDVSGFNIYHKNRLIKPFWRVWNPPGSDGRGVIGVLEANFVEPAHDKQGFERTIVLSRLEARLQHMQKNYWNTLCHKIGYAPRRHKKAIQESATRDGSVEYPSPQLIKHKSRKHVNKASSSESISAVDSDYEVQTNTPNSGRNSYRMRRKPSRRDEYQKHNHDEVEQEHASSEKNERVTTRSQLKAAGTCEGNGNSSKSDLPDVNRRISENSVFKDRLKTTKSNLEFEKNKKKSREVTVNGDTPITDICNEDQFKAENDELKAENDELKNRLKKMEESLEVQLQEFEQKMEEMSREQAALLDMFAEEKNRRDDEEDVLRKKLKDASSTIQELLNKVTMLEKMKSVACKRE